MKFVTTIAFVCVALLATGCVGPKGDAGAPGVSGKIVSTFNCSGTITGSANGLNGIDIEYDAVLTATGDVYATANIIDNSLQVSGTSFFSVGQAGSLTARVLVTNDQVGALNGGYWDISLNRTNLSTSIDYVDSSVVGGSESFTFTASACTVQNW